MNTMDFTFRAFARLLEAGPARRDASLSFSAICRTLGVSPSRFDRYLFAELGFHGAEILSIYRQSGDKKG